MRDLLFPNMKMSLFLKKSFLKSSVTDIFSCCSQDVHIYIMLHKITLQLIGILIVLNKTLLDQLTSTYTVRRLCVDLCVCVLYRLWNREAVLSLHFLL